MEFDRDLLSRQQTRRLIERAAQAAEELKHFDQTKIDRIVAAIAEAGEKNAENLARMACEETGFGNVPDKTTKNLFASRRVFEAVSGMKTVGILREDRERRVWDVGVPVGVIAGIVPSTNPTSTVLYKSLISIKAGSAVVFSPHPNAIKCTGAAAALAAEAAEAAGCPKGAISCIPTPTMDAVNELMHHEETKLILATGGGEMVHAAYSSGKPAIGVGAGNGPAYIHKSADIPKAVSDIIRSKTFDNGTVCASEQSVILERCCADRVREEFKRRGCYFLNTEEAAKIAKLLLRPNGTMNPKIVGRTAHEIAAMAGLSGVPETTPVLIARETEAGPTRPYSRESSARSSPSSLRRTSIRFSTGSVRFSMGKVQGTPLSSTQRTKPSFGVLRLRFPSRVFWSTRPLLSAASAQARICSPRSRWAAARWAAVRRPTTSALWISSISAAWRGACVKSGKAGKLSPNPHRIRR